MCRSSRERTCYADARVAYQGSVRCRTGLRCVLAGTRTPVPLAAAGEVVFRIGGDIERPQQWTLDDLAKLPRREVRGRDRDGTEATFAGVALVDLLRLAEVPLGEKLRGAIWHSICWSRRRMAIV